MLPVAAYPFSRVLPADASAIEKAGHLIREGQLVAFPTETVYGLGANALEELPVSAVFAAKLRPRINPLIAHVLDQDEASELVRFNAPARLLAEAFWPGGLTLVLPRKEPCPLALLASAGLPTAAVRVPAHPVALGLIAAANVPLVAPSANRSGRISPTTAAHVADEFAERIPLILDGGPCPVGIESTIIGFDGEAPILLRKGAISRDAIEAIVGPLRAPAVPEILAPGMMASHYAPNAELRLNAGHARSGEALLAFGTDVRTSGGPMLNLSPSGDLAEAAANLFSMLRALDRRDVRTIAVSPIPNRGIGEAINDRLARAAAPRDGWVRDVEGLK